MLSKPPMDNFPTISQIREQHMQFSKEDIPAVLPIEAIPFNESSFNDVVACMPIGSQAFKEMCMNLLNCGFNKGFMKLALEGVHPRVPILQV